MTWSDKMVPFTRSLTPTVQKAIPWALHELNAAVHDTFGTPETAVLIMLVASCGQTTNPMTSAATPTSTTATTRDARPC